jgi:hypothetical protein
VDVAGSEFDAAERDFVSTIPTTISGITAKLHQIVQLDDGAMTFPDPKKPWRQFCARHNWVEARMTQ